MELEQNYVSLKHMKVNSTLRLSLLVGREVFHGFLTIVALIWCVSLTENA